MNKAEYVRQQANTPLPVDHHCHWPGCQKQVTPAMFMCNAHWRQLPPPLQRRIWNAYRPGQEKDKRPSGEYLAAAKAAQEWIHALERPQQELF